MPRHPGEPPAIRDDGAGIEIDQRRGKWPFMKAMWGQDEKGRLRLIVIVDANEAGQVVGENANVGIIAISKKKARALRDFLDRTLAEVE